MNVIGLTKIDVFAARNPHARGALSALVARLEVESEAGVGLILGVFSGHVSISLATCDVHLTLNLAAQTV